jgi:hypothetical protein
MAKTALILGPVAGMEFIERQHGVNGILVLDTGELLRSKSNAETANVL